MPTVRPQFRRPVRRGIAILWLALLLSLSGQLSVIAATPSATPAATPIAAGPGDADPGLYDPVLAEQRDAIYAATAGRLSRYRVNADFIPAMAGQSATISGTIALNVVNPTGAPMDAILFRLYPNDEQYGVAGQSIDRVSLNGRELAVTLSVGDTVASVALPTPLSSGEAIDLRIAFTTVIPTDPLGTYRMYCYDSMHDSYALAHWLPLLAGWDPERGWVLDPPSVNGDPIFTNTALFDVTVTTMSDMVLATSGSEVDVRTTSDGRIGHRFLTGPARDFVIAASPRYVTEEVLLSSGTTVTSYFFPEDEQSGINVLATGVQTLNIFNPLLGTYPYRNFDLVEVPLGQHAGGVEFPQLVMVGASFYPPDSFAASVTGFLEFVTAHEVLHQWFYGLIGNNNYDHAFIDEGLTNFLTTLYFREQHGDLSADYQFALNLSLPYLQYLFANGDLIVDTPTDAFPTEPAYGAIVYGKGGLGFGAIAETIGQEAFFAGLRDYVLAHQFGLAQPDDLLISLERGSGEQLDDLWRHWFEAAEGYDDYTAEDLDAVYQIIGR